MSEFNKFYRDANSGDELDITAFYYDKRPDYQKELSQKQETLPAINAADVIVQRITERQDASEDQTTLPSYEANFFQKNAGIPAKDIVVTRCNSSGYDSYTGPFSSYPSIQAKTDLWMQEIRYHHTGKAYDMLSKELEREKRLAACKNALWMDNVSPLPAAVSVNADSNLRDGIFTPLITDLTYSCSEYLGVEPPAAMLGMFSAYPMALRGCIKIRLDDCWVEAPEMYSIIVRNSGGRKSEFAKAIAAPFYEFERKSQMTNAENDRVNRMNANLTRAGKAFVNKELRVHFPKNYADIDNKKYPFDVRLKKYLDTAERISTAIEDKKKEAKAAVSLFFGPMSRKKLVRRLAEQGGCLSNIDAEEHLLSPKNLKEVTPILLSAHEHERISDASLTSGEAIVQYPAISLLQLVQPDVAYRFYRDSYYKEVGLSPRFLPYFSTRHSMSAGGNQQSWKEMYKLYQQYIITLLETYYTQERDRTIHELRVEPDAYAYLKECERHYAWQIQYGSYRHMSSFLHKAHGHIARLAAAFHTFSCASMRVRVESSLITVQEVQMAVELFNCIFHHAEYAFNEAGVKAHGTAVEICKWLLNRTRGAEVFEFSTRELQQAKHINKEDAEAALKIMADFNLCRYYVEPKRSTVVYLHPAFYSLPWESCFLQ